MNITTHIFRWILLGALITLLGMQIISINNLYEIEIKEYAVKVKLLIKSSIYELNMTKLKSTKEDLNVVSYHPGDNFVIIYKSSKKYKVPIDIFDDKLKAVTVALYDIRNKNEWNLDSLYKIFYQKCKEEKLIVPISFIREDSLGHRIDSCDKNFSREHRFWYKMKSEPVRLGVLEKHYLKSEYAFSILNFASNNWDRLIMILGLTGLLGGCILNLYYGICQQRKAGEYRERFVHALVHDLKTPVQLIRKDEYLLRKSFGDKEKVNFVLVDRIREDLDTLSAKIDSLLTNVTKTEGLQVCLKEVNLKKWMEHLVYLHREILPEGKQAEFRCEVIPETLVGRVDSDHLYAALSNLLDNAVKYSGESVKIGMLCERRGSNLVIHLKDNGFGIREEEQKYIFMKNFRGEDYLDDATRKGYGLGLYYVGLVVTAHRGKIKLISKPGAGSEFIITLPQK